MDYRGNLDQSPKPKSSRPLPAGAQLRARAKFVSGLDSKFGSMSALTARWRRVVRCRLAALVEINVPPGAGAAASAMLLLASVCYGVVKGDHGPTIAANVQSLCDAAANTAGFGISEVALVGEHEIGRDEILRLAGITERSSLVFLDAAQTRARLLTNPWVAEATVLKLYPGRLRIEIQERKAFALWQRDARVSLIAADGTVLEPYVPPRFAALPLVVGLGAQKESPELLALVARYPVIARQVKASVLVAERRWNLHLKGGVEVLLPEGEPEQALRILSDLDRSKKLLSRDIVTVDLRLTDRVTVRQSDAAAAARDDALKAAAKDKKIRDQKAKAKGSHA